ncbi:MAG TPA: hypothetical protein VMU84_00655, partial [Thermoanaerobaculia bacterium]|nr:hypothetical protein [Thermoanaerobaculia bacterium]
MAKSVIADTSLLVALLVRRERHHDWAVAQTRLWPKPWLICESVLSESFFSCDATDRRSLAQFLTRGLVQVRFDLAQ